MSRFLRRNMNMIEQYLRLILGTGILLIVFVGPRSAWRWLGLYPIFTGVVSMDPFYAIFGFDTLESE